MWLVFLSGVAVVYIIFQVYSDWMHPNDMVNRRQLSWTVIQCVSAPQYIPNII